MSMPLRALIVEDSEDDARLVLRELRRNDYEAESVRVDTADAMRAALAGGRWDLILCDYRVPGFGGPQALEVARSSGLDIPFVLVSGTIGEEAAVEMMRAGAKDYVMKGRLGRLGPVVKRELADAAARRGMRRAQIEWTAAFDSVQDPIFLHDAEFRVVRANLAYAKLAGMPVQEVIGKRYWEVFPVREGPLPGCGNPSERGGGFIEEEFTLPSGASFNSRSFRIVDERVDHHYSLHVLRDVTDRNRVQEALQASERHYRKLIEGGLDIFLLLDQAGKVAFRSASGKRLTGHSDTDIVGKAVIELVAPEDRPSAADVLARAYRSPGEEIRTEVRLIRDNGSLMPVEVMGRNLLDDPDVRGIVVTARDVTERKSAEKRLRRVNRALRTLSAGNEALVRAEDEADLVQRMCRTIVEIGGYHLAWVAYARDGADKAVEIVASSGNGAAELKQASISWGNGATGQGATGTAIRTGARQVLTNLEDEPRLDSLRDVVKKVGARSVVALPLLADEHAFGALAISSADVAGFDDEELKLLEELAGDLAFGVKGLRARAEGRVAAEKLHRSLHSTIEAIAATVEMRDPYTSGH